MISDKAYNDTLRTMRKVEKALTDHNITFETLGDEQTITYAATCTIHTPNCTIEIHRKNITLNDNPVTLDDLPYEVLAIEQK